MKKIIFSIMAIACIAFTANAQTPKETITENGVTFTRVHTVADLEAIGFEQNGDIMMSKAHRAKKNETCGGGGNGCFCEAIVVDGKGQITSCKFPTQTNDLGEEIPGLDNVLPYYNSEAGVIFRQ